MGYMQPYVLYICLSSYRTDKERQRRIERRRGNSRLVIYVDGNGMQTKNAKTIVSRPTEINVYTLSMFHEIKQTNNQTPAVISAKMELQHIDTGNTNTNYIRLSKIVHARPI